MDGKMKRFPKSSLFPRQTEGVLSSTSRWKRQESKILERHQGLKIQTNLEVPNSSKFKALSSFTTL